MKTLSLEETIQWMEKCIFEGADWNEDFWSNYTDALNYLKVYRQVTDVMHKHGFGSVWGITLPDPDKVEGKPDIDGCANMPLTWDELKQMVGKPVWVECKFYSHQWAIIGEVTENRIRFYGHQLVDGEPQEEMGTVWQAYRKERG